MCNCMCVWLLDSVCDLCVCVCACVCAFGVYLCMNGVHVGMHVFECLWVPM